MVMKIGIIGAGAITSLLLREINQKSSNGLTIKSVFVRDREKYIGIEEQFQVTLYENLEEFLESDIDVVVEAANIEVVRSLIPQILPQKDVVVISVGAFADIEFYQELNKLAMKHNRKIHLPSGAIGGIDLLQNA